MLHTDPERTPWDAEKQAVYQKTRTRQYNVRYTVKSGVPDALKRAAENSNKSTVEYIKNAVESALASDGYLK